MEKVAGKRIGFIRFSNDFISSPIYNKLLEALTDFKITECQRYYEYVLIYGICDKFDIVEEVELIPQYLVIFDTVDNDILSYRFEKWQSK